MNKSESCIILCGGKINFKDLPFTASESNAMIPVHGKPVIGWILEDLIKKNILQVTVVVREKDAAIQNFLQWSYGSRMDLTLAPLKQDGTIVQSLQFGLRHSPTNGLVRIVLGDTLITDPFEGNQDFVYTGEVTYLRRWCLVDTNNDGRVSDYIDKEEVEGQIYPAIAGYYHLRDGDHLQRCIEQSVSAGERELSNVLRRYGNLKPIYAYPVEQWYDFGHIDTLVEARRRLIPSRHFNMLKVDPILNTITKVSKHDEKLRDELNWYLNIPDELKVLTPRIVSYKEINGDIHIAQEYYGYPTLAELYVYGDLSIDVWNSILKRILQIHKAFRSYPGNVSRESIESMYVDKTFNRLDLLQRTDSEWVSLLNQTEVIFNKHLLKNVSLLKDFVVNWGQALSRNVEVCIIHGDLCFSNILFDINNLIARLVDPRGGFGVKGIYGDPRYDIAKLRHSVCGLYDFIVYDMFDLKYGQDGFTGQIYTNGATDVSRGFDQMLSAEGYNPVEIRFIEGLLFISMVPLHRESKKRQLMMYLTGLKLLNEVFQDSETSNGI